METNQSNPIENSNKNNSNLVFQERGYSNGETKPEAMSDEDKERQVVISLFKMLQWPSSNINIPSFNERNV